MNDLTPQQQRKAMSEFVSLEAKLDQVLFAKNNDDDDDEDNGFPYGTAAAAGVGGGVGGVGVGAYLANKGAQVTGQPGMFRNIATGAQAVGSEAKQGLKDIWARLLKGYQAIRS